MTFNFSLKQINIVRMHKLEPVLRLIADIGARLTGHRFPAAGKIDFIRLEIPVP